MCDKITDNHKISVVVPVFNAEKYINRCIQSVIEQDNENWELILIDDGSTDKSPQMIDEWQQKDRRIRAYHQKNAGPGMARNNGIKESTGEYIVFVDADDYLATNYFSLLRKHMCKADVVFIDVLQVNTAGDILSKETMSTYKKWNKDKVLRAQMTGKIPWGGVRKAVRRTLLIDNNILYTSHAIGEEALYSMKLLLYAKKIAFIDETPVYYYVNHDGSQSKIKMDDPWGGIVQIIYDYLSSKLLIKKYGSTVNAFSVTATIISLDRICANYASGEMLFKKLKERVEYYKQNKIAKVGIDFQSMDYKAFLMYPFLKTGWIFPIILASKIRKGRKNET